MAGTDRSTAIWNLRAGALLLVLAEIPLIVIKRPTGTTHGLEIALIVGAVIVVAWGQVHQRKMANERRGSTPRLIVKDPLIHEWNLNPRLESPGFFSSDMVVTVVSGTGTPDDGREKIQVAHLHLSNEPKAKKSKEKAEDVNLSIRYSREDSELLTLNGRWSTDDQRLPFELTQRASERTLAPNGNPERCDIAYKYVDDDECFAIDDTVRFHPNDWRKYPLGNGPVDVEVTARQSGEEPVVTRWRLTHDGPGGSLHLNSLVQSD
jgi:hypothetical protein